MAPEPFVSAQEAAKFIGISRRFLTELARRGIAGAYPIGTGVLPKHGSSAFRNSLPPSVERMMRLTDDGRKATERIIQ
jgi:hypothetical protein